MKTESNRFFMRSYGDSLPGLPCVQWVFLVRQYVRSMSVVPGTLLGHFLAGLSNVEKDEKDRILMLPFPSPSSFRCFLPSALACSSAATVAAVRGCEFLGTSSDGINAKNLTSKRGAALMLGPLCITRCPPTDKFVPSSTVSSRVRRRAGFFFQILDPSAAC